MDRSVDTAPIAPALAAFFDNVLDKSISELNFKVHLIADSFFQHLSIESDESPTSCLQNIFFCFVQVALHACMLFKLICIEFRCFSSRYGQLFR